MTSRRPRETPTRLPRERLHQLFERRAADVPEAVAVACGPRQLSYRELDRRADRLAVKLRRHGVGPEAVVGVFCDRGPEWVIGVLGILKAGGAYLPLDPDEPRQELAFMVDDAGAEVLVTRQGLRKEASAFSAPRVFTVDGPDEDGDVDGDGVRGLDSAGDHAAYVIYTATPTGRAKGVINTHRGIVNRLLWMQETFGLTAGDRLLHKAPLALDVAVWEIFWPLAAGARLVLARPGGYRDSAYLAAAIRRHEVTTVHFVPSMLELFLDQPEAAGRTPLERVVASGERLSKELERRFFERFDAGLFNLYGAAEAAADVTVWACERESARHGVPIGWPIANTRIHLLDAAGDPAAPGEDGELAIAGVQVARGYLGRPALTAEKFVPDPFADQPGGRLYLTGDLARTGADGAIEFTGRLDPRVKAKADPAAAEEGDRERTAEHVARWQAWWDDVYGAPAAESPQFDLAGWTDSSSGQPMPEDEMREWLDDTVSRVLALRPDHVLEIGCGTGLLLFRIAPTCRVYLATDFSAPVIETVQQQLAGAGLSQVHLMRRPAEDFDDIPEAAFDTVLLSAVVQYFPDLGYLTRTLRGAVEAATQGGRIFVGDVRSLPLHEAFCAAVELDRAADTLPISELAARIRQRRADDGELLIDPAFFVDLPERLERVVQVRILPKAGRFRNELNRFRYDVVLDLDRPAPPAEVEWLDWHRRLDVRARLRAQPTSPAVLGLRRVPDPRLARTTKLLALLAEEGAAATAGELRAACESVAESGLEPGDLEDLGRELGWACQLAVDQPGYFTAFFQRTLGSSLLSSAIPHTVLSEASGGDRHPPPRDRDLQPAAAESVPESPPRDTARTDAEPGRETPEPPLPERDPMRLSFAQQRLWFLAQLAPASAVNQDPSLHRWDGELDVTALRRAGLAIVRRHEILRTTFPSRGGEPYQRISTHPAFELPLVDLTGLEPRLRQAELERVLQAEAGRPFALNRGPLLRCLLLRRGQSQHVLMALFHRIVADTASLAVFYRELATLYDAASSLTELPLQYADFAQRQREQLRGKALDEGLAYWRRRLAGAPSLIELPAARPRPPAQRHRGARLELPLPEELDEALHRLARDEEATPFTTLLAAFSALLGHWSGQRDLVVGTPVAHRGSVELEGLIGLFANTIALRCDLAGEPSFRELLRRTRDCVLQALAYQDLPFEKLVEELGGERDPGRHPVFQVSFDMPGPQAAVTVAGRTLEPLELDRVASELDLSLQARQRTGGRRTGGRRTGGRRTGGRRTGGLVLSLVYDADLFDRTQMVRLLRSLATFTAAAAAEPWKEIAELPCLDAAEAHQLCREWPRPAGVDTGGETLGGLFERQARATPEAVALTTGGACLSYRELHARVRRLVERLRRHGVGPELRVGLVYERSPEWVVALLAVIEAGGAFVALDPAQPAGRLRKLAKDAGVKLLLSRRDTLATRIAPEGARVLGRDSIAEEGAVEDVGITGRPTPQSLAYVAYTSGSTGRPKGVLAPHGAVVSYLRHTIDRYRLGAGDVALQTVSPAFDAAIRDLFAPLVSGVRVVLADRDAVRDPEALVAAADRHRVTVWLGLVPSLLRRVTTAAARRATPLAALRLLLLSGESLLGADVARARAVLGERLAMVNLYGPTETTCTTSHRRITVPVGAKAVAIGRALIGRPDPGAEIFVLQSRGLHPCPTGAAGELYVGGAGLARGYLGQPRQTAERFLPHCFSGQPGARLYATGDRGRFRRNGALEFLGRVDRQLKIRAFRVEPGEIEARLTAHPEVTDAYVMGRKTAGTVRLTAYFAPLPGKAADATALRAWLAAALPDYMRPAALVHLDALPRTANGKIDLAALPAAGAERPLPVPPKSDLELNIANIWRQVLGVATVSADDDFFDLGGDSLLLVETRDQLRRALGRELPMADLFRYPTLSVLARHLDAGLE